ncbi:MAG: hypothetical protein ABIR70_11585 [Bryobacteraceae bacterium]
MADGNKFSEMAKSPMLIAMLVAGVALVIGVPYLALQTFPGFTNPITGEPPAPKGDPNAGIDFQELATLPDELQQSASVILSQEEPVKPESLLELAEPTGFGLIYPVSEAVDTLQPTFSWNLFAPGPFKLEVRDRAGAVLVSVPNLPNVTYVMSKKLEPGATYSWKVTASNNEYQDAAFIVMTAEDTIEWLRVRSEMKASHLGLGLMAEHYGLLSTAEREYTELTRQFPNAEAPARLLANVIALRD